MQATPAHDQHNPDLLAFVPTDRRLLVEVGCSTGALAREYKKLNPRCRYLGVEVDAAYAAQARRHCDAVYALDVEAPDDAFWAAAAGADCWIFGDSLEHLRDPWALLARLRQALPAGGCVVVCVPNAQHWSVQARLASGLFRYEDAGLLDRTHLRWFTRTTLIETFAAAGFRIDAGRPRVFAEPERELVLPHLRALAQAVGVDPEQAVADAKPLQYVVRAVPA